VCNNDTRVFALSDQCAFRIRGGANEDSRLTQIANIDGVSFSVGDQIVFVMVVNANSAFSATAQLRVRYSDGTANNRVNIPISATDGYVQVVGSVTLTSAAVEQIRLRIRSRATAGRGFFDQAWMTVYPTTLDATLIPLPLPQP
jgi:hypothetical protein